jgi:hypothetical protein
MPITPSNVQQAKFDDAPIASTSSPPGLGPPDPIATTRLNLEASRPNPQKPAIPQMVPVKVDRVDKSGIYVKAGGGGIIPLTGLSNGSISVGQVLLAQVSESGGAAATWMPR